MALTGFSLVTTYDFRPDLWNTKPPLVIWLMSGSLRLFGFHEWALRLPSALAAIGTLGLCLLFVRKVTGSRGLSAGTAILLLLSPGFFGEHGARTADFDAVLLFFVTGGLQFLYLACLRRRPGWPPLVAAGVMIGLGALAKSIAAFIPVMGVLLFLLLGRRLTSVLANWQRYLLASLAAILPLLTFYGAREAAGPGYLDAVVFNDLAGRYSRSLIPETSPLFYLEHLSKGWFFAGPLLLILPIGLWGLGRRERTLALYAGCIVFAALAIYSAAATRAMQYALPLFPWLAILSAISLKRLIGIFALDRWKAGKRLVPVALIIGLGLLGAQLTARALWWRYEMFPARQSGPQASYGNLFAALAARGITHVTIVDPGFQREHEQGYSPLLRWNRLVWATRGLHTTELRTTPASSATLIARCEPFVYETWQPSSVERIGLCAVRNPQAG
jgi:4-amino-4-deoxy-L-arabinose transferase-like glycosyltransferase